MAFRAGLFVPWFSGYSGLTDAARPVFTSVLPALVLWFAVLSAAYRYRLLDRALGLAGLSEHRSPAPVDLGSGRPSSPCGAALPSSGEL